MADAPETPDIDETEPLQAPPAAPDPEDDDTGEEEVLTFGDSDDEVQDTDNATIRHLRSRLKDTQKELAETRRSIPQHQPDDIGPKPDLWEDCEGDTDKYDAALLAWNDRNATAKTRASAQAEAANRERQRLESRLARFAEQKSAIGKPDTDEAIDTAKAALGEAKFVGIVGLLDDTTDAGKFMYALAHSPNLLEELSSQTDAIKLVKQVTKLEGQLKMVKRRTAPDPDTPERGSAPVAKISADTMLQKLEAEAERTRDRTKVIAYKRKLRLAQR